MCGLFLSNSINCTITDIEEITQLLLHRGPDSQNTFSDSTKAIHAVHTRLAIQDTSTQANQPFFSECRRYFILYNGEVYNKQELRRNIEDLVNLRTTSDTEVLLNHILIHGMDKTLNCIQGMFAFILVDTHTKDIFAARDFLGIKPLYFTKNQKGEYSFSSEIRPLLRFRRAKVNEQAFSDFIISGLTDHNKFTFFRDIEKVIPGTYIHISQGKAEARKWIDFDIEDLSGLAVHEYDDLLRTELSKSFAEALVSDVDIALTLSSGIDSNLVRLLLEKHEVFPSLHSVGWEDSKYSELDLVRKMINPNQVVHTHKFSQSQVLEAIYASFEFYSEPYTSAFVAAWPMAYKSMKEQGITVVLDGSGADELFFGYEKYRLGSLRNFSTLALDGQSVSIYDSSSLFPRPTNLIEASELDIYSFKLPRMLRFLDMSSMIASVEVRPVFLTKKIYEIARSAPIEWHLTSMGTKLSLRRILNQISTQNLYSQRKQTFQLPQNDWMNGEWRTFVETRLESDGLTHILDLMTSAEDKKKVNEVVAKYRANQKDVNNPAVWRIFNVILWLERWFAP